MDGNGRWAKGKRLPRTAGHQQGVKTARAAIEFFARRGVKFLTLFAFSSENWNRPEQEVSALMELFLSALGKEAGQLAKNDIRLKIIGHREQFPTKVMTAMRAAEQSTAHCRQMQVTVAASYGGHWDIIQAVRRLAQRVANGELQPQAISAELIEQNLSTTDMPNPDLY